MNLFYTCSVEILTHCCPRRYVFVLMLLMISATHSKGQSVTYDLPKLLSKGLIVGDNRSVRTLSDKVVQLSAAEGYGVAWIKDVQFADGNIELDMRGTNIKQGSFLGIAFHGTSKDNCEVIYFRPFNFLATDSAQRSHMVQYVFENQYGWELLREKHPGVYENEVSPAIQPNAWFHVKIEVKGKLVKVYANYSVKPCLEVSSLNLAPRGKLGLWVGNTSPGDFAHLVVTHFEK